MQALQDVKSTEYSSWIICKLSFQKNNFLNNLIAYVNERSTIKANILRTVRDMEMTGSTFGNINVFFHSPKFDRNRGSCYTVFCMFSCLQINCQPCYLCQLLKFHPFDWMIEIHLQTKGQGTHNKMVLLAGPYPFCNAHAQQNELSAIAEAKKMVHDLLDFKANWRGFGSFLLQRLD